MCQKNSHVCKMLKNQRHLKSVCAVRFCLHLKYISFLSCFQSFTNILHKQNFLLKKVNSTKYLAFIKEIPWKYYLCGLLKIALHKVLCLLTHNLEPIKGLNGKCYQTGAVSFFKLYINERMRKS